MTGISALGAGSLIGQGLQHSLAAARGANPKATEVMASAAPPDELEISAEADALVSKGAAGIFASRGPNGDRIQHAVYVEDVRAEYQELLGTFDDRLQDLLREEGIEIGDGFQLQTDAEGRVRVVDDHPQREKIEQLFEKHPDLRDQFARLSSQGSFLRAADVATELARLWDENPLAAARRVQELMNRPNQPVFTLSVSADKVAPLFQ